MEITMPTLTEKEKQEIREKWNKAFPPPMLLGQNQEQVADWWLSLLSQKLIEQAKAFGDCKNCYGKGYATTKVQYSSSPDFGDEPHFFGEMNPIRPCNCERGKGIRAMLSSQRKEIRKKIWGMGFASPTEAGQFSMHTDGYNQALEEVLELPSLQDNQRNDE